MIEPKRKVPLTEDQAKDFYKTLEAHKVTSKILGDMIRRVSEELAEQEMFAWRQIHELAGVDGDTESATIEWVTGQICVYDRDEYNKQRSDVRSGASF